MVSPSQSGNKHNQMKEPELMKIAPLIFLSLPCRKGRTKDRVKQCDNSEVTRLRLVLVGMLVLVFYIPYSNN